MLGLSWDRIDFEAGTILIDRQLQKEKLAGGKYYLSDPKSGKPRTIVPARSVMQALQRQKIAQAEMRLRAGEMWDNSWGLVFTNETGRHLAAVTLFKDYKKLVEQIGRPDARFHDLRHSYAVAALQSGDDIKSVQGNLGHHTAAFTLDVYGHVTEKMKKQSADRMEAFISSVSSL